MAVTTKSAKIKDCHPKCLGKYRSRPRCNVKRLFAPNSHLAKLKTREVANVKHLQNVDARRDEARVRARLERKKGKGIGGAARARKEGHAPNVSTMGRSPT